MTHAYHGWLPLFYIKAPMSTLYCIAACASDDTEAHGLSVCIVLRVLCQPDLCIHLDMIEHIDEMYSELFLKLSCFCCFFLMLLDQAADTFDREDHSEDDEEDRDDTADPAPSCAFRTGHSACDVCLDREAQGRNRNDQHECHREEEHLVVSSHLSEPGRYS